MSAEYARFLHYQLKVEDGRRGIFWKYKIDQLAIDDKNTREQNMLNCIELDCCT